MFARTVERIKMWLGWCPTIARKERKEDSIPITDFVHELRTGGFRISLASLHLIIGIGLLVNVLYVLKNMPWFPNWIMGISSS